MRRTRATSAWLTLAASMVIALAVGCSPAEELPEKPPVVERSESAEIPVEGTVVPAPVADPDEREDPGEPSEPAEVTVVPVTPITEPEPESVAPEVAPVPPTRGGDIDERSAKRAADVLRRLKITVVDPSGAEIDGVRVYSRRRGKGRAWKPERTVAGPFSFDRRSIDYLFLADEYGAVESQGVLEGETVVLEPVQPSEIKVRLADGATLPDGSVVLAVEVDWVGPIDGEPSALTPGRDPRSPRVGGAFNGLSEDARTVTVSLGNPGRYRIRMVLSLPGEGPTVWMARVATVPADPIVTIRGDGKPVAMDVAPDEAELSKVLSEHR